MLMHITMADNMAHKLTESLRSIALKHGADIFGTARTSGFIDYRGKRNPQHYLKDARSVIVIGMHVFDPCMDAWIGSAAGDNDFYIINEILGVIAHAVIQSLGRRGHQAVLSPYSGIYTKDAAALAHLGHIGKNNLLITPQYGPRVRLRAVVTDASLHAQVQKPQDHCTDCPRYCRSACPAQAFGSGTYDKSRCQGYSETNVQRLREHGVLFCRECELACPKGRAYTATRSNRRMPFQVIVFPYYIEDNRTITYALFRRPKAAGGYWQAIAGGVQQGESVFMAAGREAYEEAGIEPDTPLVMLRSNASLPVTRITDAFTWGRDVLTVQEYSFGIPVTNKRLTLSDEHVEYQWVDYDTALTLLEFDSNKHALHELNELIMKQSRT